MKRAKRVAGDERMTPAADWDTLIAKHLPPSGATLRVLDLGGAIGGALAALRADLDVTAAAADLAGWAVADDSIDAVVAFDQPLSPTLLQAALSALRPGGRLIALDPAGLPSAEQVETLRAAGYTRILVELAQASGGVLLRGEKAHTTADTLARIRVAAGRDDLLTDLNRYPGRYLYLLIQQTPNKPVWALRDGEALAWRAVALTVDDQTMLLAFSSLAKAIAFMQPAVLAGQIRDINKVGKFSVHTAHTWALPLLLNPDPGLLAEHPQTLLTIDPATAEQPDE